MQIYGDDYPTPDGTCIRDYIHVSDLVAAHRLGARPAARRRRQPGWPIGGYGHGYSVLEVMDSVKRVYGGEIDVRITGRRPGDAVAVVANSDLARKEFGWVPQLDDLERIVSDTLS